jgi:hypothetical protein
VPALEIALPRTLAWPPANSPATFFNETAISRGLFVDLGKKVAFVYAAIVIDQNAGNLPAAAGAANVTWPSTWVSCRNRIESQPVSAKDPSGYENDGQKHT